MSEKKARLRRYEQKAQGIDPNPEPRYNFRDDLPDTREQRRTKKFRKKAHARELETSSVVSHRRTVAKWNRVFYRLFNNPTIKAINRAMEEDEAA